MRNILLQLFILIAGLASGQNTQPAFSIFLIGDAGKDVEPGAALVNLKSELLSDKYQENSSVVFLGDNVYQCGIAPSGDGNNKREESMHICCKSVGEDVDRKNKSKLFSQLDGLEKYRGNVYMVPGNHDWQNGQKHGQEFINLERDLVAEYFKKGNLQQGGYYPKKSFGPEEVLITTESGIKVRIIFLDTQWWLHTHNKKIDGLENKSWTGKKDTLMHFLSSLKSTIEVARKNKEYVVICAHHPIFTYGKHGKHGFNLQVLIRRMRNQSIGSKRYDFLKKELDKICQSYAPDSLFYVAGHDHNLQYFKLKNYTQIVSGAGSRCTEDDCSPFTKFREENNESIREMYGDFNSKGFFRIDFYPNSKPNSFVYKEDIKKEISPEELNDFIYKFED